MSMYSRSNKFSFTHVFDLKELKSYSDYADRDIQRALDFIEEMRAYQKDIHEHAQKVAQTDFIYKVIIQRSIDYYNKVNYFVSVHHVPKHIEEVEHKPVKGTVHDEKKFSGKERHEALKYAAALTKKYNCQLIKKGFPRRNDNAS